LQIGIVLIIFYFLAKSLVSNWNQIREYSWDFHYPLLLLSFALVGLAYSALVKVWEQILKQSGHVLSYSKMFKIWFISNLGRYVPGKVWQFLGMLYLLEKEDVPKSKGFSVAILAQVLSSMAGILIMIGFVKYDSYQKLLSHSLWLLVLLTAFIAGVIILIFYPKLLQKLINFGLEIFKKEKISFDYKPRNLLFYLLSYAGCWLLFGFCFLIFIKSIVPAPFEIYFGVTGAFAGSATIGFLALFAPGGIGVREGVLVALLSSYFPVPVATLIALLSRVWITLAELLLFFIALAIR
jgi:uncharacterized membrane protein YbhN (UPF0104 family)